MASARANGGTTGAHQLNFNKSADEIRESLAKLTGTYQKQINEIIEAGKEGPPTFERSFGRLAAADGAAALLSAELTLPALVSSDAEVREVAASAKKQLQQMWSTSYASAGLYRALVAAEGSAASAEEKRMVQVLLAKFRHVGAHLPEAQRLELQALDEKCAALCLKAEQNINEDCSNLEISAAELDGCPTGFIQSLPNGEQGKRCSLKAPVLAPILQRCHVASTRKRMLEASQCRCPANGEVLEELLATRHAAAKMLGFSCHAERMLSGKMAGSLKAARSFCEDMLKRLEKLRDRDLERLAERKRQDLRKRNLEQESTKVGLDAWDVSFYSDLLKREDMLLDDEKLKEFFPLKGTIHRILEVYTELLGLEFQRRDVPTWNEEVVAFEVKEHGQLVGHLFLDQFPRDGKFSHQMIVPLAPAFTNTEEGMQCLPACVNISNLPRSEGARPALLRFSEMKTLFHELGHVMHCLCTRCSFSVLSWAWPMVPWPGGVEQDFLEVPSMALEKFACEPLLLQRVARHFEDGTTLETSVVSKIQELERWMAGIFETRGFAMALFDLLIHSQAPPYSFAGEDGLSSAQLFRKVMRKYTKLEQLEGTNFGASWYHLYIGYDAGVYGYCWSDVYAADIYAHMRAAPEGALSSSIGQRLRAEILQPCATRSGQQMLQNFLGREANAEAWCQMKGLA